MFRFAETRTRIKLQCNDALRYSTAWSTMNYVIYSIDYACYIRANGMPLSITYTREEWGERFHKCFNIH